MQVLLIYDICELFQKQRSRTWADVALPWSKAVVHLNHQHTLHWKCKIKNREINTTFKHCLYSLKKNIPLILQKSLNHIFLDDLMFPLCASCNQVVKVSDLLSCRSYYLILTQCNDRCTKLYQIFISLIYGRLIPTFVCCLKVLEYIFV